MSRLLRAFRKGFLQASLFVSFAVVVVLAIPKEMMLCIVGFFLLVFLSLFIGGAFED